MKEFALPFLLSLLILYAATSQIRSSKVILDEGTASLRAKQSEISGLEDIRKLKESSLSRAQEDSFRKKRLLREWSEYMSSDSFMVGRTLDSIITSNGCVPSNSSSSPEKITSGGVTLNTEVYNLSIIGDFKSIVALIGEIEETFPSSLITFIKLEESVSGVSCRVSVAIPKFIAESDEA